MAEHRRVFRKTSDDSEIRSPATSFEDELKQKAMTLGRRPKQGILHKSVVQIQTEGAPPPPPSRTHSRRGSQGSSQINDCTAQTGPSPSPNPPARTRSIRKQSSPNPAAVQSDNPQASSSVSSIASSFETEQTENARVRKFKPAVPKPQPKPQPKPTPQQSNPVATGIASSRALLEAKFGGRASTIEKTSQDVAPAGKRSRTFSEEANRPRIVGGVVGASLRDIEGDTLAVDPPLPSREYAEPFEPASGPIQSRVKAYSGHQERKTQGYESSHSSGDSRISLIKESSSTESLDARVSPPKSKPPPPLPPKADEEELSEPKPRKKPVRSKSFKSTLWTHNASQKTVGERTPPPEEPHPPSHAQPRDQLDIRSGSDVQQISGPTDLLTIVTKGANFLPMCVQVCHGFCSSVSESNVFSKFEELYLHFIKHCKVCVLKDECTEEQYTVPMGSALEFGILYEGEGADVSQFIHTAGDIMKLKPLPVVIQATKSFDGGSPEKSVEANELLFLKKTSKSLLGKNKVLEVSSLDGTVKRLSSTCEGDFSIHPYHIKMSLPTLIEQSVSLPQRVYLFPSATLQEHLPTTMTEEPALLESIRGETSVICTMKEDHSAEQVMDIEKDLAIQVQMQPLSEREENALQDTTSHLHHTLNPAAIKYIAEKRTKQSYDLQCILNQDLVAGKEMEGVHFQLPNSFPTSSLPTRIDPPQPSLPARIVPPQLRPRIEPPPQDETSEITSLAGSDGQEPQNDYEDVGSALAELPAEEASKLAKSMKKSSFNLFQKLKSATTAKPKRQEYEDVDFGPPPQKGKQLPTAASEPTEEYEAFELEEEFSGGDYSDVGRNIKRPSLRSKESGSSAGETESNYAQLNGKIGSLVSELNALKTQVQKLTATVEGLVAKGARSPSVSSAEQSQSPPGAILPKQDRGQSEEIVKNKEFLKTLSNQQVLQLLDNMSLSNYKGPFQKRSTNGEQLLKLNEQELEDLFELKTNFHRKKLMRVVSGALNAGHFLSRTT